MLIWIALIHLLSRCVLYICKLALSALYIVIKPNEAFVIKVFQGEGFDEFFGDVKTRLKIVKTRKPDCLHARFQGMYLVATGYKV
ncbi:SAM-dependent methyltransferase [Alteromonas facilis]|uniref:SAM-dependent methyltransferase n=1 Tax=Alteromonas facilis TaxID=2048004 RepID=UPI000F5D3E9B